MVAAPAGILPHRSFWPDGKADLEPLPANLDFSSTAVSLDSATGRKLQDMVKESLPRAHLVSALRFGNRALWEAFQFTKAAVKRDNGGDANVCFLFHATKDPSAIFGNGTGGNGDGFDFRRAKPGSYGQGAYFARHAAYCVLIHPRHEDQDGTFCIIVAEVALGDVREYGGKTNRDLRFPPVKHGTVLYNSVSGTEDGIGLHHATNRHAFGEQYVVYAHNQAYPHFLLRVRCPAPEPPLNLLRCRNQVAFYAAFTGRYLQMSGDEVGTVLGSGKAKDALPLKPGQNWERFTVVDAGGGEVALYNSFHRRFLRMWENKGNWQVDGDAGKVAINDLGKQWLFERWRFVDVGRGKVALWNPHFQRFLLVQPDGCVSASGQHKDGVLPEPDTWERFIVIPHPGP